MGVPVVVTGMLCIVGCNKAMKNKLLVSKNTPYFVAGSFVLAGLALLIFSYMIADTVTRDPNMGADLLRLFGVLLLIGGTTSGLISASSD